MSLFLFALGIASGTPACSSVESDPDGATGSVSSSGSVSGSGSTGAGGGGAECPEEWPDFGGATACSAPGVECDFGMECCCGNCFTSYVCECSAGFWSCYYTDACFGPCEGAGGAGGAGGGGGVGGAGGT
jgi:hypothetical protein